MGMLVANILVSRHPMSVCSALSLHSLEHLQEFYFLYFFFLFSIIMGLILSSKGFFLRLLINGLLKYIFFDSLWIVWLARTRTSQDIILVTRFMTTGGVINDGFTLRSYFLHLKMFHGCYMVSLSLHYSSFSFLFIRGSPSISSTLCNEKKGE